MTTSASALRRSPGAGALPHRASAPQEELQLGRLEALLVNRSADPDWWDEMALQVDRVTDCFRPHLVDSGAGHGSAAPLRPGGPRTSPELARLEAEHRSLLDELVALRSIVDSSSRSRTSVSGALAAATEVIALLRGHNRRHGMVAKNGEPRPAGVQE